MNAKPRVTCAWVAGVLVVGLLAGGCTDMNEDYARDAAIVPLGAGSILIDGTVQSKAEASELQYDQTHGVNSFDDFDSTFRESSNDVFYVPAHNRP
jgi:hypothetical protein